MHAFGEKVGIAFQMKDDLMDYGEGGIGKPTGIDLKEKKLTLPIIYTINQADASTRSYIIRSIKKHNNDKARVKQVITYVNEHGGIEYTAKAMLQQKDEALAILDKISNNEYAQKLRMLVEYVINRNK